ncbi:MAG TPA: condensation domain-containing protein, partial [Paucimonas sp.]|nr:condensation domain-containing protein [Paucimonas sp.]
METNKNPSGSGQDMLAIARRLAGLPADKRAIFRQRLRESGIDFSGLPIVPLSERPASIPLSFAQQRLWFLHQLEPGSAAYNIPTALKLEGRLDNAALESAFKAVIARHESLRTVFREIDGKAEQLVLPAIDFRLPVIDLSGLPCDEREAEALRLARTDAVRPFDLGAGPLMRAALLKLADTEHILAVTMHHIVSDGWSMNVLLRELGAHYAGKVADLRPLAIQYADFALWQQEWLTSDVLAAQLDYWKAQLGNEHPVLELPADRPRPLAQSGRGAKLRFTLSEALTAGLRQYAKEQGATLFMTTLAAFSVLLHRLSGQNDIRIGVPIANRNRIETENVIGFFVNTQVLRAQPDARMSFVELLARVKEAALGAQAHQDLPFEQLVEALQPERNLSHSPLFQAMFNLQTSRLDSDSRMGDMRVQALPQDSGAAQFDLSLDIVERQGRLEAALTYSTDLFEAATVERFAGYYTNLLDAIVAAPHARIGQLPMLGRDEYHQLTSGWGVAASVSEPFIAVHAQFEAQARTTPDAIALVYDDAEFTYAELNAQANRLAHRLIAAGIGADARAGVCIERSPAMIVALLAILKAGGAYVPLDPNYPA